LLVFALVASVFLLRLSAALASADCGLADFLPIPFLSQARCGFIQQLSLPQWSVMILVFFCAHSPLPQKKQTNPPEPRKIPGDFMYAPIGFDIRDLQRWNSKKE